MDIRKFDLAALPEGQWVDIHYRPSHKQVKSVYKAMVVGRDQQDMAMDVMPATILALVDKWALKDPDGRDILLSRDGIDNAPQDTIQLVFDECTKIVTAALPNQ